MKKMPILFLLLALVTSACASISKLQPTSLPDPTVTPPPPPQYKILFIGNSLTFYMQGLDYHTKLLAGSADPPLVIEVEGVKGPGMSLESIWQYTNARETIKEGNFDLVVLQEDIPASLNINSFYEYAPKFVAEIRDTGAEPVLYMTWPYKQYGWIAMEEIAQAHRVIATELEVEVAPVGLAFQRAMEERPELDMYDPDGEHPSIYGMYLAANVVVATVFDKSPIGFTYLPEYHSDFSEEEAAFLQRIAWETTQEYQSQQ